MTEVLMWHSKKPRRSQLRGFSIPFWVGGLIPRLATSYSSPSNHRMLAERAFYGWKAAQTMTDFPEI